MLKQQTVEIAEDKIDDLCEELMNEGAFVRRESGTSVTIAHTVDQTAKVHGIVATCRGVEPTDLKAPIAEEPIAAAEEPVAEEPVAEEPAAEEPAAEEPEKLHDPGHDYN